MHPCPRAALIALAVLCSAGAARAQVVLSGQWRSGATAIDVQVESWGKDCGPPPQSSQSPGGSIVRVVQVGEQLQLHTGGRIIKSDVCFGQNPGLKRTSKTVKDNTWVTRCETGMDDPRAETGAYTLKLLSPERLLYQDVSRFRWQLKESLCVATITTVQTLSRLSDAEAAQAAKGGAPGRQPQPQAVPTAKPAAEPVAKTPPAAPTPPKLPDLPASVAAAPPVRTDLNMAPTLPVSSAQQNAKPAPCVPGPAARLALAPRRRTIELGSKLCFRTRVVDKAGCALPPSTPTWSLDHGPALRAKLDPRGCFEASSQAADGEGSFQVSASVTTAQGTQLRAEAELHVVAADLSALVAKRLFDQPDGGDFEAELAADISNSAVGEPDAPISPVATSRTATRAVGATEAPTPRPPWIWPAIGALLAMLGGAIALVARRRARASEVPERVPELIPELAPQPAWPADDDPATSQTLIATTPKAATPVELRCPKCGALYPAGSAFCGTDGSPLKG